jgi:hypothetical protein
MIKLIDSNYDKETGVSWSKIRTEIGDFEGAAFLHPEDRDSASSFLGCEIAEYRATIHYFEKKLMILNIKNEALEKLKIDFDRADLMDAETSFYRKTLRKRLEQNYIQKKEYKANIMSLRKVIDDMIDTRIEILKKLKKEDK